jgi:hypothetical protein
MREKVRSREQGQTETPVERVEMNIGRESHNEDKANLGNTIVLVCSDEHPELLAFLVSTEGDSVAFDSTKYLRP